MNSMRQVSADEMRELDQMAMQQYGIPSLLLMENAGRGVSDWIREKFGQFKPQAVSILIFCGKGNNGGDGLVAARHLKNHGFQVQIVLIAFPTTLKEEAAVNFNITSRMHIPTIIIEEPMDLRNVPNMINESDIIIDALFGTGLNSPLTDIYHETVKLINESQKKIVAVDVPSGLNSDTGEVLGIAVKANMTATLGLPKKGLYEKAGPEHCGEIRVIDISLPKDIL